MSIYTTPLSRINASDLQELLTEGAVENVRLEFKSEVPNRDETLKKLSSFANTFGGFVVVGAKANSADGRLQDLCGVDEESGYKQKLNQWAFDSCSPPLVIEVSNPIPVPSGNGKVCYVIYVPESDAAPHFLNGRKGVWIRTDEFSARFSTQLADERELRHLLDRRAVTRQRRAGIIDRAASRFKRFTNAKLGSDEIKRATFLSLCVVPRFPARSLCEQEGLAMFTQPVETNWVSWRQVVFPDPGVPVVSQHESLIILNAARSTSFLEINIWGLLYYGVRVDEDRELLYRGTPSGGEGSENRAIHLSQFAGYILLFVQHARKMLQRMGYSGPLHTEIALAPICGVKWLRPSEHGAGLFPLAGSELDDSLHFPLSLTSDRWIDKADGVAMEILKLILFAVNLPSLVDTQAKLEALIGAGYQYNFWPRPASLSI